MKVKELQKKLAAMDPDLEVYLSRDEEGNGFCNLADCEEDFYRDGEPVHSDDVDEYIESGYTLEKGVTLWP